MKDHLQDSVLKRGLKNRHIQLLALGSAMGTGLFLGTTHTIQLAGPAVLLGYAIAGFISLLILRQLGEMVVEEPVAGSFSYFSYKYWGDFAGFLAGWNYWVMYILNGIAELTAIGIYIQYWWPEVPTWASVAVFFVLINLINMINVRIYGETEFWLAIIKVAAVIGMIIFGAWLLVSGNGGPQASAANLWEQGGFMPNGLMGLVLAMPIIMFSFAGLELIGMTAAEAEDPQKSIPKATNQVIWRIFVFYIASLAVLLSLYPWNQIVEGRSPFVMVFDAMNSTLIATILNIVVLTAALSVYNSGVYCTSRMLLGLAQQGNAPERLVRLNKHGVPVSSLILSASLTSVAVLVNYVIPVKALELLMALVVSSLMINWIMICLSHLKFRAAKDSQGQVTQFKALWYPWGNYLCLIFLVSISGIMFFTESVRISVLLIPVWMVLLWCAFLLKKKFQ